MSYLLAVDPPVLTPYYDIIKWVLIFEIIMVVCVGLFGIGLQWIQAARKKMIRGHRDELKHTFLKMLEQDQSFNLSTFPSKLLHLSNVLIVILEMDQMVTSPQWKVFKNEIATQYLLPKARKVVRRPRWTSKLQALRCFTIVSTIEDEEVLIKLLDHKFPVVKFTAAHAAVRLGTENVYHALVDQMNHSTHFLRQSLLDALVKGGKSLFTYLERRLETETDPFARLSCIEGLQNQMNDHIVSLIEKDLHAEHKNLNLRIGAIRALGHYPSKRSIELLLPFLKDVDWEIRALSARSLGYLQAELALPTLLELCGDKTWWVRMSAALALKKVGDRGVSLLKTLSAEKDRYAYDIGQYVLSLSGEENL